MQGLANIASAASGQRVRELLRLGVARLAAAGVDSPRLDAEVLLAECLTISRAQLLVGGDLPVDGQIARRFDALLARRGRRGRPTLGSAPARVESVRLDPELQRELSERAKAEGTTVSEVIREALRRYLRAA